MLVYCIIRLLPYLNISLHVLETSVCKHSMPVLSLSERVTYNTHIHTSWSVITYRIDLRSPRYA